MSCESVALKNLERTQRKRRSREMETAGDSARAQQDVDVTCQHSLRNATSGTNASCLNTRAWVRGVKWQCAHEGVACRKPTAVQRPSSVKGKGTARQGQR